MNKKDFFFIVLAILIFAGFWYIGTQGEKIKNWVGRPAFTESPQTQILPTPYFSDEIQIETPGPNEFLKGGLFRIQGRTKINREAILIRLIGQSQEFESESTVNLAARDEQGWQPFSAQLNAENHDGFLLIEIYDRANGQKLASFTVKIVRSI